MNIAAAQVVHTCPDWVCMVVPVVLVALVAVPGVLYVLIKGPYDEQEDS